jgi:hypothetical protein
MPMYDFAIVAAGSPELTDELAERLYEAGAEDCSAGTCDGVMSIDFHRDADSFEAAVRSAIGHMQAVGLTAARVVVDADAPALRG